jgi:hypothetical protein
VDAARVGAASSAGRRSTLSRQPAHLGGSSAPTGISGGKDGRKVILAAALLTAVGGKATPPAAPFMLPSSVASRRGPWARGGANSRGCVCCTVQEGVCRPALVNGVTMKSGPGRRWGVRERCLGWAPLVGCRFCWPLQLRPRGDGSEFAAVCGLTGSARLSWLTIQCTTKS